MTLTTPADIAKEINAALKQDVIRLGSDPSFRVSRVPTGMGPIDLLLDGGLPRGRFVEVFGAYSTLKSYLGLAAIHQAQQQHGLAVLVDTEHAYDPTFAYWHGVIDTDLLLLQPNTGEEAVDAIEMVLREYAPMLVVWDSVAATLPSAEYQKRMVDADQPARLAAFMSKALRKLNAANSKTAIMMINQTRINVGQMFGNPETVPGGKALPFYASYRLSFRRAGKLWEGTGDKKRQVGESFRVTVEKSKLSSPHREVQFDFYFEWGVDEQEFLIREAVAKGLIAKNGGWYEWKGKKYQLDKLKTEIVVSPGEIEALLAGVSPPDKSRDDSSKGASRNRKT